jgi:hypothetical protein
MIESVAGPTSVVHQRGHRRIRFFRNLIIAGMIAVVLAGALGGVVLTAVPALPQYGDMSRAQFRSALKQVSLDLIGEKPRIVANPPSGDLPLCRDVSDTSRKAFLTAFGLMRGTTEGARLYDELVEYGICVDVDEIDYVAAYARSRFSYPDGWSSSRIVVDRDLVRSGAADVLAAVLVHEATHIDRAISGKACFLDDSCDRLPNGVEVDEEVAAHAAEAEWWIAAFGTDGKRFAVRVDYSENRLVTEYLRGAESFRAYVATFRSDPREGEDFD